VTQRRRESEPSFAQRLKAPGKLLEDEAAPKDNLNVLLIEPGRRTADQLVCGVAPGSKRGYEKDRFGCTIEILRRAAYWVVLPGVQVVHAAQDS